MHFLKILKVQKLPFLKKLYQRSFFINLNVTSNTPFIKIIEKKTCLNI